MMAQHLNDNCGDHHLTDRDDKGEHSAMRLEEASMGNGRRICVNDGLWCARSAKVYVNKERGARCCAH
uniref:Uncharacterized protein n=1 Tax=Ascaris lumbricoides TaxID=6252 RepID=A0A0M3HXE7_ASCLU